MSVFHLEFHYVFSIKIHDLNELKEVYTIVNVEEEKGNFAELATTAFYFVIFHNRDIEQPSLDR